MPLSFKIVHVRFRDFQLYLADHNVPFDPGYEFDRRLRFVLVDGTLFIGDIDDYVMLCILGTFGQTLALERWLLTDFTCDSITRWESEHLGDKVQAAGKTNTKGEVTTWRSHHFDLDTPHILHQPIQEAIKSLIQQLVPAVA